MTGVLAAPVVIISMLPSLQFTGWQWVCFALTVPVFLWGALPFHLAAVRAAMHRTSSMDTLVSIGTTAAFLWSTWALFFGGAGELGVRHSFSFAASHGGADLYFEVTAAVIFFILLGRTIESRMTRSAKSALDELAALQPAMVTVVRESPADPANLLAPSRTYEDIPVNDLRVGDLFLARFGERVAADGDYVSGGAVVDARALTGESMPSDLTSGDAVLAGSEVLSGSAIVRATRAGGDSEVARMARFVDRAQSEKSNAARLADRVSAVFVPAVLVLALLTFVVWLSVGEPLTFAVETAVAVLIIACPCALGLAIPVALAVGSATGARRGIAITRARSFEVAGRISTLLLDKTGTITDGEISVANAVLADDADPGEVRALVAGVEAQSVHPVAVALRTWARDQADSSGVMETDAVGGDVDVRDITIREGIGVTATATTGTRPAPVTVDLVNGDAVQRRSLTLPASAQRAYQDASERGSGVSVLLIDDRFAAIFEISDRVRSDSSDAIARLATLGITPVIVSGDAEAPVRSVANQVGVTAWNAGLTPLGKSAVSERYAARGEIVGMVGDGVNDAAVLAQADLGLAIGTGTAVAEQAADVTLIRPTLSAAVDAITLSRKINRVVRENLVWAFLYNALAIPLAAFGLLNPMIAGAAMALSSICVVLNSLRLHRF